MSWAELGRDLGFAVGVLRRRPFSVLLQVTNRCNMACDFCSFWSNGAHPKEELTLADFERLEADLSKVGRFAVSIEGGEPFVRPDLLDIVEIFSRRHLTILFTNGWHVTEENARLLFDRGLNQVGVSIDFPDAARHDAKRRKKEAWTRAWRAVDHFRDAAKNGQRQVQVMTVYMDENRGDLAALLAQSAERGVGHTVTLLATGGTYRADGGEWPSDKVSDHLVALWKAFPHFSVPRRYLELIDPFLAQEGMPTCRAGIQSFNVDHLGNVSPCIEKIGQPVGNVREAPLATLLDRMRDLDDVKTCQDCWTLCRGVAQLWGQGGSVSAWRDMFGRMRAR